MKELLLLVIISTTVGMRSRSLRWRELGVLMFVVGLLVFWQTFNIVFRYISVE